MYSIKITAFALRVASQTIQMNSYVSPEIVKVEKRFIMMDILTEAETVLVSFNNLALSHSAVFCKFTEQTALIGDARSIVVIAEKFSNNIVKCPLTKRMRQ
jgi:hypothetical protein